MNRAILRRAGRNLLLIGLLTPIPALGADCGALADQLAQAAAKSAVKRVAVVPFRGAGGSVSYGGAVVSERLVTQMLARGGIEVVERHLLQNVMQEQRLGAFGIMDPRTVKALGRVLGVDALVTGTIVELRDDKVEVNARLVDAETARVLSAASGQLPKDWTDFPKDDSWQMDMPELPAFDAPSAALSWRDGLNSGSEAEQCREAEDKLEGELLLLKARFWASKLKDPSFSAASLRQNPGSEIKNLETRSRFYAQLKHEYEEGGRPLTSRDVAALKDGLQQLKGLSAACAN